MWLGVLIFIMNKADSNSTIEKENSQISDLMERAEVGKSSISLKGLTLEEKKFERFK